MIKSVYYGSGVMDENILETLTKETDAPSAEQGASGFDMSEFSEREMEIIRAVAEGLSNKEIAAKLFISEGTVKNHISGILSKTGLSHRTALAVYYLTGKS
ncbi:MAG: response regulator transcription factor [Eubacterium sp.]|nr:response regulator transcription factor [Eubacterium sp.]